MTQPSLPLFASIELAARIEHAEHRLMVDSADAVARRGAERVFNRSIAGGSATWTGDDSPFNKVAGIGFEGPVLEDELEAVERAFGERGAPVQVELSTLAEPSIAPMLCDRGYVLQGFEDVLGRGLPTETAAIPVGIEITPCNSAESETWLDTLVTGFAHPDTQGVPSSESFPREALEQAFKDMAAAEGLRSYLARRNGDIAGGGSMRICNGVVQLCGAATLPDHRRHGVQSALLDQRLQDAQAAGCDIAVVTTQPGSKSKQNVQRKGFHLLYTRAILVRSPP